MPPYRNEYNIDSIIILYHIYSPDKACWDINKESQCFYADPDCPQREDKRLDITKDSF